MSTTYTEVSSFETPLDRTEAIYSEGVTFEVPLDRTSEPYQEESTFVLASASGLSAQSAVNRVWDTVAADFVRWATSAIDSAGASYPGPGTFGVDTSDYVVETIQFTRV